MADIRPGRLHDSLSSDLQYRLAKRAADAVIEALRVTGDDAVRVACYAVMDLYEVCMIRWFTDRGWEPLELERPPGAPTFGSVSVPGDWNAPLIPDAPDLPTG